MVTPSKALSLVQTPFIWVPFAVTLLAMLFLSILCLIFVPWQQSVIGFGKMSVFSPSQRPQTVNAQIKGRIKSWFVIEGQVVQQGDTIVTLDEVDAKFLDQEQLPHLKAQWSAQQQKAHALQNLINVTHDQIASYANVRQAAVPSAGLKIQQTENKIISAQQKVAATHQSFITAQLNLERRKKLFTDGLRSKRDLELAEQDFAKTQAEYTAAQADLNSAYNENQIAEYDQSKVSADTMAKIQASQAKLNESMDKLGTVNKDMAKLAIDIANLERRIAQRTIKSPVDGRVVRLQALGFGETVKEGEPIALIVPKTVDQAVELYVSDFNAALVSPGRKVRLQFSGWPAVQFVGWPSIAVGTFAGEVAVIDAVDDGANQFRMLIKPDYASIRAGKEEPWPSPDHLRPGAKATGWILLDTVPLGFELWRQFNGFPPSVQKPVSLKSKDNKAELKRAK